MMIKWRMMLAIILPIATVIVTLAHTPGFSQEQAPSVEQMQACIAKIDQTALKKLAHKGKAVPNELRSLCISGKRDQAKQEATKFAKLYAQSKEIQFMRKCGKQMISSIPDITAIMKELKETNRHVCDIFDD